MKYHYLLIRGRINASIRQAAAHIDQAIVSRLIDMCYLASSCTKFKTVVAGQPTITIAGHAIVLLA